MENSGLLKIRILRRSDLSAYFSTRSIRSHLNTAKVMVDNPATLRLKELETLERVAERIDRISVFGGLGQGLNGQVTLKAG